MNKANFKLPTWPLNIRVTLTIFKIEIKWAKSDFFSPRSYFVNIVCTNITKHLSQRSDKISFSHWNSSHAVFRIVGKQWRQPKRVKKEESGRRQTSIKKVGGDRQLYFFAHQSLRRVLSWTFSSHSPQFCWITHNQLPRFGHTKHLSRKFSIWFSDRSVLAAWGWLREGITINALGTNVWLSFFYSHFFPLQYKVIAMHTFV